MSSKADLSSSSCRLEITMSAPASARPRAIALPNPLLPPVTNATLPVNLKISNDMLLTSLTQISKFKVGTPESKLQDEWPKVPILLQQFLTGMRLNLTGHRIDGTTRGPFGVVRNYGQGCHPCAIGRRRFFG